MTPLKARIIESLQAGGIYTTKGMNAILPDLIEESIYTAQELGIDYFLANTSLGAKTREIVIRESTNLKNRITSK
jgi:hypothetical protein